jgi:tetratricopeptide (TPR) repeat protein
VAEASDRFPHLIYVLFLGLLFFSGCSGNEGGFSADVLAGARTALQAERFSDALRLTENLLQESHPDSEGALIAGLAAFKLGDYRRAAMAFAKAEPQSLSLQTYLAYLYLLIGDAQQAIAVADALTAQFGKRPEIAILAGNIALKREAYTQAERHFRDGLAADKLAVKAYIGLANTYLIQRQFSKAEENYLTATFLSDTESHAFIALSHYYIAVRRYEDAELTAKGALVRFPDDLDLLMVLSNLHIRTKKTEEALKILTHVQARYPHSIDLKIRIIRSYFEVYQLDEAYKLIRGIMDHNPDNYFATVLLGEYFIRKNDIDLSLLYFNKSLLKNENSYIVNYYLGLIHLLKSNTRLAIHFLERSIEDYPGFPNSHLTLACIYLQQHRYHFSINHANIVLKVDPGNVQAHLLNGLSLYMQNHPTESQYELDAIHQINDNIFSDFLNSLISLDSKRARNADTWISYLDRAPLESLSLEFKSMKILHINHKNFDSILEIYTDKTNNYLVEIEIGDFYKNLENLTKAESYYKKAIMLHESAAMAYYSMGGIEVRRGNLPSAMRYFEQAIARQPSFAKSYLVLGALHERERHYHRARMVYEQGLSYAPQDSALLNNLAWVEMVHLADASSAYLHIRKAIDLSPNDSDIQDTLAWWYYLKADYAQAITRLEKLVAAYPEQALFRYHLGLAYLKDGATSHARTHLIKALEGNLGEAQKAEIRDLIP